ncbi:transcriptional regulator [Nonomuraea bangladeshensis]|uniref:transcriptional regulator n=1 Tax=Nonomuraea bangladeshensis TaxID=404385 RepID=UPI003C2B7E47
MTHPTGRLSDVVHQRHRLGILAIADEAARVEFTYLHDVLELTRGNLNRHLAVLEEAGLIVLEKGYDGRRPKTWVVITGEGRAALSAELTALEELIRRHGRERGAAPPPVHPSTG